MNGLRLLSLWVVFGLASIAGALDAQSLPSPPTPHYLVQTSATEKAPRTAGDWVVWTRDATNENSTGTVVAMNLVTSQEFVIGPGFLPDIDVYAIENGGGVGVPPPGAVGRSVVRVAWLQWHRDGRLSLQDATFDGTGWSIAELVGDLGYANHVRISGNYSAWTGTDEDGSLRVHLHDGRAITQPSAAGVHAFRPELARSPSGEFALVWDEYRGAADGLDYEVYGRFRAADETWSATEALSAAPESIDFVPAVAPAADGGWWIAWESDRGALFSRIFVMHRASDGEVALPQPYPPSTDQAQLGVIALVGTAPVMRPVLQVDEAGRLWLIAENKAPGSVVDKQLLASWYDSTAWSEPVLLPGEPLGEKSADAVAAGTGVRIVYQGNAAVSRSLDVALVELEQREPAVGPRLTLPAGPPLAALPHPSLQLPGERTLSVDGVPYRLAFADLHSHCGQSPDGIGELDHAVFWARDLRHLDVWASTDHDESKNEPYLDWEYELARRLVDLFDSSEFTTYMGFEWSNHENFCQSELIGHRATFSSRRCYRYLDPAVNDLPEYYAAMTAEDALGVPHHLGKFGGSSFLAYDPFVQPVTEVSSGHGQYEDLLIGKLLTNPVRFGVTAAGDDHLAMPGTRGLAGVYYDSRLPSRRDAIKQALRDRRCFGVALHGLYADIRLNGRPMGQSLTHAGDLLLRVVVTDIPVGASAVELTQSDDHELELRAAPGGPPGESAAQAVHVNISRNGQYSHPIYSRVVEPGGSLNDLVVLPGQVADAFYMLRVTRGATGSAPKDTLLWSSPIWVDSESPAAYPRALISPPSSTIAPGTPFLLVLGGDDPQGLSNLADMMLHITLNGTYVGAVPLWLLTQVLLPVYSPGGVTLSLPVQSLPAGEWGLVVELRDKQGHKSVASTTLTSVP